MNQTTILWPVLAQVLLVYLAYGVLGWRRRRAMRDGIVGREDLRDRQSDPPLSRSASANVMNQFELPVLFYVVCLALLFLSGVSYVALVLAWLFVISRYVHAFVHLTSNRVALRGPLFASGWVVLALMWVLLALRLCGLA